MEPNHMVKATHISYHNQLTTIFNIFIVNLESLYYNWNKEEGKWQHLWNFPAPWKLFPWRNLPSSKYDKILSLGRIETAKIIIAIIHFTAFSKKRQRMRVGRLLMVTTMSSWWPWRPRWLETRRSSSSRRPSLWWWWTGAGPCRGLPGDRCSFKQG